MKIGLIDQVPRPNPAPTDWPTAVVWCAVVPALLVVAEVIDLEWVDVALIALAIGTVAVVCHESEAFAHRV